MSWEEAHPEAKLCAICERGAGMFETDEGRMICGNCLSTSGAEDVIRLRSERRRGKRKRSR